MLELRSKPCFKRLFVKSPLKIRKNFPQNTPIYFGEAFEIPKDFSRKVLLSGSHGGQPQLIMHAKKRPHKRTFFILYICQMFRKSGRIKFISVTVYPHSLCIFHAFDKRHSLFKLHREKRRRQSVAQSRIGRQNGDG